MFQKRGKINLESHDATTFTFPHREHCRGGKSTSGHQDRHPPHYPVRLSYMLIGKLGFEPISGNG